MVHYSGTFELGHFFLAMHSSTKDSRAINIHDNFFKRSTRSIRKRSSGNLRLR